MKFLFGLAALLMTGALAQAAPADVVKDLAPNGRLRAAINFGNPVLAQKDPGGGEPRGVSVALARELGRSLGVPVDFVLYTEAAEVSEALATKAWDVAFLAIDPVRAGGIAFTAPYVLIEGVYVVPTGSALTTVDAVDREGLRIGVAKGSAYDLFLTRTLKHAEIVRVANATQAFERLAVHEVDIVAGVKQPFVRYLQAHPDLRMIPGHFMEIDQAMGTPKGRDAGLAYLRTFVEAQKASGFIAKALAASGQADATIAPAVPKP